MYDVYRRVDLMAKESSFDVVSEIEMQLVDNAIHAVEKEIAQRYDFKGSQASLKRKETEIDVHAEDDYKVDAINQILQQKAIKQGIDLKFFDFGGKQDAAGGQKKEIVTIKKGISKEKAKEINLFIKDLKLKVTSQIQGEAIRVFSKDKDILQRIITELKGKDFDLALSFTNYR